MVKFQISKVSYLLNVKPYCSRFTCVEYDSCVPNMSMCLTQARSIFPRLFHVLERGLEGHVLKTMFEAVSDKVAV